MAGLLPPLVSANEVNTGTLPEPGLLEFLGEWDGDKQNWLDPVLLEELQQRDKDSTAKEDQGDA